MSSLSRFKENYGGNSSDFENPDSLHVELYTFNNVAWHSGLKWFLVSLYLKGLCHRYWYRNALYGNATGFDADCAN